MLNNNTNKREESESFESYIENGKKHASRTMCLLGSLLYLIFAVVDFYSVSVSLSNVFLVRGVVITGLLLGYSFTYSKYFIRFYAVAVISMYLLTAIGIEVMIYFSSPEDHASKVYFTGLILIIMTIFTWAYFELKTSLLVTALIISSYFYLEVVLKSAHMPVVLTNIFFLVGASVIGVTSQLMRDRYVRENFFLQLSLKEALEAKTEEAEDHAYHANHDVLTGLSSRRYVTEQLEGLLQTAQQKSKILLILFIDLNGFKQINDIYGHAAGDEVLKIVARRLELAIRDSDCLSRLGGDEYLIGLLIEKENLPEVESMVDKYTAIISDSMNIEGQMIKVGASIGMAAYPIHGNSVNVLMDIADKKMYQTKHGNKESVRTINENNSIEPVVIFPGNRRQK